MCLDPTKIINTYRKNNNSKLNKSIIISYRESSEERRYNLKCLLDYYSHIQDGKTEIIIVEQDDISKINWLSEIKGNQYIKHIFVQNDGIFNKGWGYNIGAKNAKSDIFIFSDSDIFIKPRTLNGAVNKLSSFDVINPYKSVIFLDKVSSENFKKSNYTVVDTIKFKPVLHTIITGGIFLMKKEAFFKLKGFDEDCYGYGHEDDILDEKIRKFQLKVQVLNDTAIHMHHESSVNNNDLYYSFIEINKKLYSEYQKLTLQELIDKLENIDKWGDIDSTLINDASLRHIKRTLYEQTSEKIVEYTLSKFTDKFLDEIVNDISNKIYNDIIEIITEKVKKELGDLSYSDNEKQGMLRTIMKKFRL